MTEHDAVYCSMCSDEITADTEVLMMDDSILCGTCYDNQTMTCDCCGVQIWRHHNCGDNTISLCASCFDGYYTTCDRCERIIQCDDARGEDDDNYCESCYEYSCEERIIKSYDYKPYPIFYGDGARYLGVELEIDEAGECDSYAEDLLHIANRSGEHVYCKHDGSLYDGLELVTHPMTLDYHMTKMPWDKVLRKAIALGYHSHQAKTCGLHVHVNRNSFGKTIEQQDAAIARVLFFIENHWGEFLRFSRRTQEQLSQWAARYGRKSNPKEQLDSAKDSYARYSCVNLTNNETIEFRLFRGTLKLNTIIATLQLVDKLCDTAVTKSDWEVDNLSWVDFIESLDPDETPELITYLKERRLYVNEPVLCCEEV